MCKCNKKLICFIIFTIISGIVIVRYISEPKVKTYPISRLNINERKERIVKTIDGSNLLVCFVTYLKPQYIERENYKLIGLITDKYLKELPREYITSNEGNNMINSSKGGWHDNASNEFFLAEYLPIISFDKAYEFRELSSKYEMNSYYEEFTETASDAQYKQFQSMFPDAATHACDYWLYRRGYKEFKNIILQIPGKNKDDLRKIEKYTK